MHLTLYLVTGRSDFFGGSQCKEMETLPPVMSVSPSVKLVGGPGFLGSAKSLTDAFTKLEYTCKLRLLLSCHCFFLAISVAFSLKIKNQIHYDYIHKGTLKSNLEIIYKPGGGVCWVWPPPPNYSRTSWVRYLGLPDVRRRKLLNFANFVPARSGLKCQIFQLSAFIIHALKFSPIWPCNCTLS